ncbi:hypothetical protein [Confluentibacter flavum]|uniref:Uncharacterized protein n=1 Tax=Confluentibacter flavum TaxID=1909700 RepID=A0A2N3HGW3_9FLAO|nr:hypothetical protein [Confluentibacter flavum]PKQ44205.1 hypothetical protein CSW08_13970 [Confluentibacter flavum]
MSRLYYESPSPARSNTSNNTKEYLDKVSSLIPAEIVAAYLTLISLAKSVNDYVLISQVIAFAGCLILTPIYLNYMAEENKPKLKHIIISTVSFIIWAYVISGDEFNIYYNGALSSMILIFYSLIVGLIKLDK